MDVKRRSGAAVVTENAAQAVLRRGAAPELSGEEEKVMRMRLGAAPPRSAPLERSGSGRSDLEIELLSYEIEAFMKLRELGAHAGRAARAAEPRPSRAKEKIVRALRKKT